MIALLLALVLAQAPPVSYSFSPQGPEPLRALVGKLIPGEQIVSITVCAAGDAAKVSGGEIYQIANANGLSTIAPLYVPAITKKALASTWQQRTITIVSVATGAFALMATGGAWVAVPIAITRSAAGAHFAADLINPTLSAQLPDPAPLVKAIIDPALGYAIPPRGDGCFSGSLMAQFSKKSPGAFAIPAPQAAPAIHPLFGPGATSIVLALTESPTWVLPSGFCIAWKDAMLQPTSCSPTSPPASLLDASQDLHDLVAYDKN